MVVEYDEERFALMLRKDINEEPYEVIHIEDLLALWEQNKPKRDGIQADPYFARKVCSKCQRYPCNSTKKCIEVNLEDMVIKYWLFAEKQTDCAWK